MYPSDMTDAQWQVLAGYFAEMNKRGRPRVRSARDMINAIFLRTSHQLPVVRAAHPGSACTFACREVLLHNFPLFVAHVTWIHDDRLP